MGGYRDGYGLRRRGVSCAFGCGALGKDQRVGRLERRTGVPLSQRRRPEESGEKELNGFTDEGLPATTTFQIADVTRPLCSIAKVCDKGNRVIFEQEFGYIEDEWGTRSYFQRKGNIYTMNFVALDTGGQVGPNHREGFHRQSE